MELKVVMQNPGYFLDLTALVLSLNAFVTLRGQDDAHVKSGVVLLRRHQGELSTAIGKHIAPIVQKGKYVRFKARVEMAARDVLGLDQAILQAQVLQDLFAAMRADKSAFDKLFAEDRFTTQARKIAVAADSEAPESILNSLSGLASVSRLQAPHKWIIEAAALANVAPTEIENTLADAATAKNLGSDLRTIEAKILSADPTSKEAATLQEHKQDVLARIEAVASTSRNPNVVLATVAAAATQPQAYVSKIGAERKLSPDQEKAMLVRGKGMIAAGAGSGKTTVLAAKVVYHINELGVPAQSVLATSFSKKSAAELRERITRFGVDIPKHADTGFGTTHSISAKLMREYGGTMQDGLENYEQTTLVMLAMRQVEMGGATAEPPKAQSIFANLLKVAPTAPSAPAVSGALTFSQALDAAERARIPNPYLRGVILNYRNSSDKWYGYNARATKNFTDPRGLSPQALQLIMNALAGAGVPYSVDTDPNLAARKNAAKKQDKRRGVDSKYLSATQPVNQWFNLGLNLTDTGMKDGKPLPIGQFKRAITKYKGYLLSPTEAWAADESPEAAVYAAYEYLKSPNGELAFANRGDFDDVLINASKMLLSNPRALKAIQDRFRVVLIDEAQDLNRSQFLLFGLIAGYVDPAKATQVGTAKNFADLAKSDGSLSADTYCFIGDDKQCVDSNSMVDTDRGPVRAGDLSTGDKILSYRNGKVESQTVKHAVPSSWTWGYKVTTESGHTLTMSPNHKLWASEPQTEEGQMAVYLMYQKDMGFRVGITNKGKAGADDDYLNSYGGKAFMEKAERMWILDVVDSREEALLQELSYSLDYGIPTMVFEGENLGLNQERIDQIFKKHGHKGARLLEDRHLSFDRPHWMSQSYTKHGRQRHTLQFLAHSMTGSQVMMEWEGDKFDAALSGMGVVSVGNRRRLRKYFKNYRDGLGLAQEIASRTGANLSYRLATPEENLRETTAAGLFVGMRIPVLDGESVSLDRISVIEKAEGGTFIDLDVEDASNFFANGILTHNSIYEFRSADPETFIDMSDLVEGGAGFKTLLLKTNYRSGEEIVEAANRLISHNSKQVPMVCNANPNRVHKGAVVTQRFEPTEPSNMQEPAEWLAKRVEEMVKEGTKDGYNAFGVGLRSNAEAYAYGLEFLKRGIPFRAKVNFFSDPSTKAFLHWLTIANEGRGGNVDRINDAVLNAVKAPVSFLGSTFTERLTQNATGNYLEWLVKNGGRNLFDRSNMVDNVQKYVDNLLQVVKWGQEETSQEMLFDKLLTLQGADGRSIGDALVDKVEDDPDILAELQAEAGGGEVSRDAIEERAMAPLAPLRGLLGARADLTEAMKYIRTLQSANAKYGKEDDPDKPSFKEPAVTLGTMHSWKGLEVENMFIPVVGGRFPRTDATEEDLASERRLMYVALTRGENHVTVMNIPGIRNTKNGPVVTVSRFIQEICVPNTGKVASAIPAIPEGRSFFDPDLVAAYLRGENPMALMTAQNSLEEAWGTPIIGGDA
jgi:DNA helicase-2/ATP-dependent DNA helicase PcrA